MVDELSNSGAIPVLEMMLRFAGARQRIIVHNIANLDTPDFRPVDASPQAFQKMLRKAADDRAERTGTEQGELRWRDTREVRHAGSDGRLGLVPTTPSHNILFHDRNNRDLERTMQDLAENVGAFRISADLLRSRYELLRSAISERV